MLCNFMHCVKFIQFSEILMQQLPKLNMRYIKESCNVKYSQTCVQRPPSGSKNLCPMFRGIFKLKIALRNGGLCRQDVVNSGLTVE
jgi:hypothetical protein